LEKADVRTNAVEAYDWQGFILKLEVGKQNWLNVRNLGTRVSMSDLWELKFHAVAHEKKPEDCWVLEA
jgi:hypothetical protein